MSAPLTLAQAFEIALRHHNAGELQQAEIIYRQILDVQPDNPDALHLLGLVAHQVGQNDPAIELIGKAIQLYPDNPHFHANLGAALLESGRFAEAAESLAAALLLQADFPECHFNHGLALANLGQHEDAIAAYQAALNAKPNYPEAANNLGAVLFEAGRYSEAADAYRHAVGLRPEFAEAHNNLGAALKALGKFEEAIAHHRKALYLDPANAGAYNNLGTVFKELGRNDEAIACYRQALELHPAYPLALNNLGAALAAAGQIDDALSAYQRALELQPDYPDACNNLGALLRAMGHLDEAIGLHRKALVLQPANPAAANNLGVALMEQGDYDGAIAAYRDALRTAPRFAEAHNNLAAIYKDLGRFDEAIAEYRQALEVQPDSPEAHSNLLLCLHYGESRHDVLFAEHRRYAERFEVPFASRRLPHANPHEADKRLKIGYVSADFRKHSVAYFIEPVLEHHDRHRVEVYCYANNVQQDAYTARLAALADHWIPCHGLSDGQLATRIRADGIDVLIDLSGHTSHNRLPVFARKPAPVQVSWLGYIDTTGLGSIDYRLTNADADPPDSDIWYSEKLYRFAKRLWWCYRPEPGLPELSPPPAIRNGRITFGSLNYPQKISSATVETWASLLHAVPASRLILAGLPAGTMQESMRERFAILGISAERLTLHPKLSTREYRALANEIDIALDPFPFNGGTTTCETLWLGLPVISLRGEGFVSRMGYALLKDVGLVELVADNPRQYVEIGSALAADLNRLTAMRAGMRDRLASSSLCDETGFTLALENSYREMWTKWCTSSSS